MSPTVSFNLIREYWAPFPWGTEASGITNTCNFDSFLAHIIFLHRHDPTYFARVLNHVNSVPEHTIRRIVALYSARVPNAVYLLTQSHFMWRSMLMLDTSQQARFLGTQRGSGRAGVINMASTMDVTVFQPLSDSSLLWFVHSCSCRESVDPASRFPLVYAEEIQKVVDGVFDSDKSKKKCKQCQTTFNSRHRPFVAQTTWFIHFPIGNPQTFSHLTLLSDIPEIITLPELRTGNEIDFQLGFISYTHYHANLRVPYGHTTSVHLIGRNFYEYDGMERGGDLRPLEEGEEPHAAGREARYAVYFRL